MSLSVGLGGGSRNACVALCTADQIIGICEQERITRVRGAGINSTGLPDEALDELLQRSSRKRGDIAAYGLTDTTSNPSGAAVVRLDHHFAHACSAFLTSPFDSATIIVCDHEHPEVSVWDGNGRAVTRVEWPWRGPGFAAIYSQCAEALGFAAEAQDQRMEALARFDPTRHDERAAQLFSLGTDRLELAHDWRARVEIWRGANIPQREASAVAAALQSQLGDLLVEFVERVQRRTPDRHRLCVGGSLFFNSYFNTRVKLSGAFDEVFVPINPGNAGLSVGAGLHLGGNVRPAVTPFLGPSYNAEETKVILDNCKLNYSWASETDTIAMAVENLKKGRLVALFDGPMEWGPRALGARSIVASPFAPYVLENLNRFLKHRPSWRGYALSVLDGAVRQHFDGPDASPFMECDYVPKDGERFRHIRPGPNATLRIQTVTTGAPPYFRALLQAFGEVAGAPILVNTSFNGFREPIVCSPRDAVRVFFGTGIDTLVIHPFVINK
jgi:carbamoyltransferase